MIGDKRDYGLLAQAFESIVEQTLDPVVGSRSLAVEVIRR